MEPVISFTRTSSASGLGTLISISSAPGAFRVLTTAFIVLHLFLRSQVAHADLTWMPRLLFLIVRCHTCQLYSASLWHPVSVEKVMPVFVRDAATHGGKP